MGTQTPLVWLSREGERMTSHPLTLHEHTLLQRSAACPRKSAFETAAGSLVFYEKDDRTHVPCHEMAERKETNGDRFTRRADEEIGATSFASPQRRSTCSHHSSEEEKGAVAESPAHPAYRCPPHRAPGRNRASVSKHRERAGCLQLPTPWETHRCGWLPLAPVLYRGGPSGKPDGHSRGGNWLDVTGVEQGPTWRSLLHARVLLRPRRLWVERHGSPAAHEQAYGHGIAYAPHEGWRPGSLCPGGTLLRGVDYAPVRLYLPTAGGRPRARRLLA